FLLFAYVNHGPAFRLCGGGGGGGGGGAGSPGGPSGGGGAAAGVASATPEGVAKGVETKGIANGVTDGGGTEERIAIAVLVSDTGGPGGPGGAGGRGGGGGGRGGIGATGGASGGADATGVARAAPEGVAQGVTHKGVTDG